MTISFDIHNVTRVSVETRTVEPHDSVIDHYVVHHITLHYKDNAGEPHTMGVTLYGDYGLDEVPFTFKEEKRVIDEPPPAIKLEMERDLKGAVAMGKVWGEVFDSLFSPKRT